MFRGQWQLLPEPMKTKGKAREAAVIRKAGLWKELTHFRVILDWKTGWNCFLSLARNNYNKVGVGHGGKRLLQLKKLE